MIHLNKEVIFVKGLLLNEEADIFILYTRANINYGYIKKLYYLSKDRIAPICKVSIVCGGCVFKIIVTQNN